MSTQVATSHTVHARAPLRVPKRPPMNHVAIAIQKFIPYVVVFLLSLMLYSRLTSKTDFPPYYPPNKMDDSNTFAKDILSGRVERLEELKNLGETNSDVKVAPYNVWNNDQANELKRKLSADMPADAARVVSELKGKVMEDLKDKVMDTADSVKSFGEKLVEDIKDAGTEAATNTQEFAYDEIYAWKQKAGVLKDSTKDKLKDIKEDVVEAGKEKVEGVIEKASESLQSVSHNAWDAIEKVVEVFAGKTKDTIELMGEKAVEFHPQAAYDHQRRIGRLRGINLPHATSHNGTFVSRISSLFERVKEGLVGDEEVRRASSLNAEWENMDFHSKVGGIVSQLCNLGDDVVEEVMRKLESERAMGTCFDRQLICPK